MDDKGDVVELEAGKLEIKRWKSYLSKIKRRKLTIHKGLPAAVGQSFSLALNYCHLAELEAKSDTELWKAKIQLAKLKAVWVVDLRGGLKNGRTWEEKVRRRCNLVLVGKIDEVWQEACEIEEKRMKIREKKNDRMRNGIQA